MIKNSLLVATVVSSHALADEAFSFTAQNDKISWIPSVQSKHDDRSFFYASMNWKGLSLGHRSRKETKGRDSYLSFESNFGLGGNRPYFYAYGGTSWLRYLDNYTPFYIGIGVELGAYYSRLLHHEIIAYKIHYGRLKKPTYLLGTIGPNFIFGKEFSFSPSIDTAFVQIDAKTPSVFDKYRIRLFQGYELKLSLGVGF